MGSAVFRSKSSWGVALPCPDGRLPWDVAQALSQLLHTKAASYEYHPILQQHAYLWFIANHIQYLLQNGPCVCMCCALQEALAAGHTFSISANGVLLCEGPLPIELVREVSQKQLNDLWAAEAPT